METRIAGKTAPVTGATSNTELAIVTDFVRGSVTDVDGGGGCAAVVAGS